MTSSSALARDVVALVINMCSINSYMLLHIIVRLINMHYRQLIMLWYILTYFTLNVRINFYRL